MQIREEQGSGKYAVASRLIRAGELVHASRALACVPTIGRLRALTHCVACLSKIASSSNSSPATHKRCPTCRAAYCSAECQSLHAPGHLTSGECAVYSVFNDTRFIGKLHESDTETAVIAALLAKAVSEGYGGFPRSTDKEVNKAVTKTLARAKQLFPDYPDEVEENCCAAASCCADPVSKKEAERKTRELIAQEVDIIMAAPRSSVAKAFPEFAASAPATGTAAASSNVAPAAADSVAPVTSVQPATAAVAASAAVLPSAGVPTAEAVALAVEKDKADRAAFVAINARFPSFSEFSELVSNVDVMRPSAVDRAAFMCRRYRELSKKVAKMGQDGSSSAAAAAAPFFPADVSFPFFFEVYGAFTSNNFGVFDQQDKHVAAAVCTDASYFNHSCAPSDNLVRRRETDSKSALIECFYASQDIKPGEWLTIDYTGMMLDSSDAATTPAVQAEDDKTRRRYMLENYRFWCGCPNCKQQQQHTTKNIPSKSKLSNEEDENSKTQQNEQQQQTTLDSSSSPSSSPPSPSRSILWPRCDECHPRGMLRSVFAVDGARPIARECRFCFSVTPLQ